MNTPIRYLLLTSIFLSFSTKVFSQKCKFSIEKTDPFTGVITKANAVKVNQSFVFTVMKIGSDFKIYINVNLNYKEESQAGDSVTIKIVTNENPNGFFLTLYSEENAKPMINTVYSATHMPTASTASGVSFGNYTFKYEVTEEDLMLLSSGLVSDIRIYVNGNDFNVIDIKKKVGKKIQKATTCIII